MNRKILLAVDGSVQSFNALRYVDQLFTDLPEIYLHLLTIVPCGEMPVGQEWLGEEELRNCVSPGTRKRQATAHRFMEEAVLQLGRRGVAPEQVSTAIQLSRCGVAEDIYHEARQGKYDAVLTGRRGVGKLEEFFAGSSISAAMMAKCYEIPVWIVEGKVINARNFLVPVDRSFNCLKATDHLAFILKDNPYAEITLFHLAPILGSGGVPDWPDLYARWGEEWCREHLGRDDSLFHGPSQSLLDGGFPGERIHRAPHRSGLNAPSQIIQQSLLAEAGTIVIGRRAKDSSKGFFKGVSVQVVELAKEMAVWVVG